jgi:RNase H-fold protein (predicted Holliday junction resolvase)
MPPVIGIDPGTRKCGYAVIEVARAAPLAQGIVGTGELAQVLSSLRERFALRQAAVGGGTHSREVEAIVRAAGLTVAKVDERDTTLKARVRYFEAHPPRGWKRLIPRGMLVPERPIDDFAAVLIAERFLGEARSGQAPRA